MTNSRPTPSRRGVPYFAASVALLFAISNIAGWVYAIAWLKDPFRTNVMAPNTSLCLMVAAGALLMGQRKAPGSAWRFLKALLAAFIALAGLLTLLEYVTGLNLGIDRLFLRSTLDQWSAPNILPGRFAPNTAAAFLLIGAGLLWQRKRVGQFRLGECLALPVFLISFLTLMGYAYGVEPLYGIASYSAMALQTAICLGAVSIGLLWTGSDSGVMSTILGEGAGGVAARRLLFALFVIFPALGWLRVRVQDTLLVDLRFGTALLVIVCVIIFGLMIVRTALALDELDARRAAAEFSLVRANAQLESLVDQRTSALRRLSARLLHLQDDERRKIARDLHDGLGQYLAALSINIDQLCRQPEGPAALLADSREVLDRAITETRTLSHLLHPPLLDEVGFHSAARWYVEGFAARSGMQVNLNLPADAPRLPAPVEIALFRVLQESLTNIHRHSGSTRADITLTVESAQLCLTIRDYGKGIASERLDHGRAGNGAGVGLNSMSERVNELGGSLEITNTGNGTLVQITIPLPKAPESAIDQRVSA